MPKSNKKTLELIKDNLNLIILVPTVMGGLWQLFELQGIRTSFIRFFSITQVIPDGLLILFVCSIIYLSFKFGIYIAKNIEREPRVLYIIRLTILPLFLSLPIIFFLLNFNEKKEVNIFLLGSAFYSAIIIIGVLVEFIGRKRIKRVLSNEWVTELIGPIIVALSLIGSLYFISFTFKIFHKSFLLPENLKNVENIECLIESRIEKFQILYLNDKYIFIELTLENKIQKIEIIKFSQLFEKSNCR